MAGRQKKTFDPLKLHRAKNAEKVLEYLKREGVKFGAKDDKGDTPIHGAKDDKGDTPIHAYVRRTDSHKLECMFSYLINAEYDINWLNTDADTPLHLACKVKCLDSVKALVAFDADINVFNRSNQTPLDIAKVGDCKQIVELLEGVGGLTGKAIMDLYQDTEDHGFVPELSREVVDMSFSMGGAAGVFGGRDRIRADGGLAKVDEGVVGTSEGVARMNGGISGRNEGATKRNERSGVSPDALASKLQHVKDSGNEDFGYQRQGDLGETSFYYSPPEEKQMDSIPEGSDEEFETPNASVMSAITEQLSKKSPQVSQDSADRIVREMPFPIQGNKSPSPIRYSPRSYSPTRPSSLLKSSQSPTRSPTHSRYSADTSSPFKATSTPDTYSKGPPQKIPISRSPPPEMSYAQKSRSPHAVQRQYSRTPPPERSISPISDRSKLGSNTKSPQNVSGSRLESMTEMYKVLMQEESQDKEDEEEDQSEATDGEDGFYKRFAQTMMSYLNEADHEAKKKMESYLAKNLGGEDYNEFEQQKEKGRKDQLLSKPKEYEATDYTSAARKKPTILTTSPEKDHHHLRSALKSPQQFSGRRHTDAAVLQRRVHFPEPGQSLRPLHLRSSVAALNSSLSQSRSLFNPKMSVLQSELGTSVMPGQMKIMKKGQRGHRILCLDGGGIKGVVELEILRAIERLSGCTIPELFDWIVGTSVGGIFSLGMVYGNKKVSDLQKMVFTMKDNVMKKKSWLKYSCDTDALEDLLKGMFGKKNMRDQKKPKVMITAVRKNDTSLPLIFFNNCFNDAHTDYPVWKVARYTSAAPVFFKSSDGYVDGGMVANNPCNYGLTKIKMSLREIKEKQKKRGDKMTICTDISCMLSLGCGDFPPKNIGNCDIDDDLLNITRITQAPQRIKNAVQTLLSCISRSEDDAGICRIFCEEMQIPFYRFNPKVSEELGTTETDCMKICDCIISTKKMLHRDEAHLEALIRHLGKEPVPQTKINTFV